jgi:hypothetical protein
MKGGIELMLHPTTPQRLTERQKSLEAGLERLAQTGDDPSEALPRLILPCGCKVEQFNHHGIIVSYCERHATFVYSSRDHKQDVFYFVTEENKP